MASKTVVLASAGTGKTQRLVEVYVSQLMEDVDPLRMVAVTFTEKAAAEMRDRIQKAVYSRLGQLPADEQGRWMRILTMLPAAPISTIHGFCGMLLREHGLELGLDPSFTILDEQRSLDLARESAVDTIRSEIRSGSAEAEGLFGDFGLDKLVETMVTSAYWLNSLGKDAAWLAACVERQRHAAGAVEKEIAAEISKYGGNFEAIGVLADEAAATAGRHPLKKRDDPAALLPKIGQVAGVEAASHLSRLVALYIGRFRARKAAANALDFDDLLLGARDLLRDHPSVRQHYNDHFQAMLVDEFQDTDEVQAEIIRLLAPARLFIVGDPKQSIYRFRRARVTVFLRMVEEALADGGVLERLQHNYRSAAPLAEFSNRLSRSIMDGTGKKTVEAEDDLSYRIRFSEDDLLIPKSDQPFLGITYVAAESDARAGEGRCREAEAIARLLKKWKADGTIQSWREVAMLLRGMPNVETYLSALEAHGVPVYVVQGTGFYRKSEVSDLIAVLEWILHPEDPLLRATVMSSSIVGVTFNDLVEKAGDADQSSRSGKLIGVTGFLRHWIDMRDRATAAEILQDVSKLIEITRELARQGTTALDDVVRYLRGRALDPTVREEEAQIFGQSDEVLRILTVHQAKGLEFDIVILPDLAARGRSTADRTVFSDRWGILAGASYGLHRKPLPHSLILAAKDLDEDQQYEEEKRLLYVAVTRARKMLVLGEGFSRQTGPWLRWIEQLLNEAQPGVIDRARAGQQGSIRFRGRYDFSIKVLPASRLAAPEQLTLNTDAILIAEPGIALPAAPPRAVSTLEMTPSDLSSLSGCFRYFQLTRILSISEPGLEPTGDTPQMRLGSVAHKVLESGSAPSVTELADYGLNDLSLVFESDEWRRLSAGMPEREMPFIMHLAVSGRDCWVRGRMDAVVPADPPRVIDYKYALWREGAESGYDIQMTAYSLALMKSLRAERAVAELWYLKNPMKILRREYTLRETEERLKDLLARYAAAVEKDEWPMAGRTHCDKVECGFRPRCWSS
jgi:ATP-dependent helicase/nuclease subunit A